MRFSTTIAICLPVLLFFAGRLSGLEEMLRLQATDKCYENGQVYRSMTPDGQRGLQFEPNAVSAGREADVETSVYYFDPKTGMRNEKLLTFSNSLLESIQWDGGRALFYGPDNFEFEDKAALAVRGIEPTIVFHETRPLPNLPNNVRGYYLALEKCNIACIFIHVIFLPC
jgi:hypothetical protein